MPPTFSWDSPNQYSQFKIFKQKVEFAFKGTYKESDTALKVCTILNWLGDNAYEIYEHLHWAVADDKDDPDKVLKAFESYFKPEQNQFHSWYTLGSIYSSQFKCQHDFLTRLREAARDCSFTNADEIVRFLFLMHNQITRVREELLKSMKTTDSLHDALHIAHLAEGKMHTEELSKQYLDTVKKDTQIDSTHHNKPKHDKSQGKGHGQQHLSNSGKQGPKTKKLSQLWVQTPTQKVSCIWQGVFITARGDITPNVAIPELVPSLHSVSQERNYMMWSRNPMVLVNTLNLNRMVSM